VIGETRFVGLFTSDAYSRSPQFVPLIRQKVQRVIQKAGHVEGSHNAKKLEFVLSTYPRDELFQIKEKELLRIATGIAQGFDRPRTRLFVRRDPFDRFASILVYVPLEHYNTRVRVKIGEALKHFIRNIAMLQWRGFTSLSGWSRMSHCRLTSKN